MMEASGVPDQKHYRCPLCGKEFLEPEMKCPSACPLSKTCNLLCCPHCGYSFPERSATVDFLRSIWRKKGKS